MKTLSKITGVIGFTIFLFGASCMDSPNLTIPVFISLLGLFILSVSAYIYNDYV